MDRYDTHAYWLRQRIRAERTHRGRIARRNLEAMGRAFGGIIEAYKGAFRQFARRTLAGPRRQA